MGGEPDVAMLPNSREPEGRGDVVAPSRTGSSVTLRATLFGVGALALAAALFVSVRAHVHMAMLDDAGVATTAVLVDRSYASSAQGMRSEVATYEFVAPHPVTGQPTRYRRTSPRGSLVASAREGDSVTVRYLAGDPDVSALQGENAWSGNQVLLVGGLLLFTLMAAKELADALRHRGAPASP